MKDEIACLTNQPNQGWYLQKLFKNFLRSVFGLFPRMRVHHTRTQLPFPYQGATFLRLILTSVENTYPKHPPPRFAETQPEIKNISWWIFSKRLKYFLRSFLLYRRPIIKKMVIFQVSLFHLRHPCCNIGLKARAKARANQYSLKQFAYVQFRVICLTAQQDNVAKSNIFEFNKVN